MLVEVWTIDLASENVPTAGLSPEEEVRAARFINVQHAQGYRRSHGALRQILSLKTSLAPSDLVFARSQSGKPFLPACPAIHFNLSHSGQYALVAVASAPVGIDIEQIRPISHLPVIAARTFGHEVASFDDFFTHWTRHEALLKAAGTGLRRPHPDPAHWHLQTLPAPVGYAAALATSQQATVRGWRLLE